MIHACPKPPRREKKAPKPIPRGTWRPTRSARIAVRTAVAKVNRKRQKREKVRTYGTLAHKAWIHAQVCVVSGQYGTDFNPIVAAHTKGDGGTGYKASARHQVPMLYSLHQESHGGIKTFEAKYGVSLVDLAKQTYARFLVDMREAEYALGEITEADVAEDVA